MNSLRTITTRQNSNCREAIGRGLASTLRTVEPQTVVEWADKNFYLSPESSYIEGEWQTIPYQVAPLNSMGNDDIRIVNLVKSARVGYTKMILALIAYMIEHKKRNGILWQPTDGDRDEFSKEHVDPMIRDVRAIRRLFPHYDKKSKGNTIEYKLFTNSRQLFLKGGKSGKNYREKSVDFGIYDELSAFDADIDKEGDAVSLGDVRMKGAAFPKSIRGSTPKEAGTCQISKAGDDAEEHFRRYYPCPHCGKGQILKWGGPDANFGIKYFDNDPTTAAYMCEHCAALIDNDELPAMDRAAVWTSDNGVSTFDGNQYFAKDGQKITPPRSVTWYMWAAFCSPGGSNWEGIVRDFIQAKKDPLKLKVWVNTTLGEVWEDDAEKVEFESLYMRREHYPHGKVPMKCLALIAGVDLQDDRIEVSIWGFGLDAESWLIEHEVYYGDPGRLELWTAVEQYLIAASWEHESGATLRLMAGGFDTGGHHTTSAYKFCKKHESRRFYALKGSNDLAAPLTSRPTRSNVERVRLFSVGTTEAKDLIYGCLKLVEPGPGYVHFPVSVDEEYFKQLTGEKKGTEYRNGRQVRRYKAFRPRVEALDCYVYARAALEILKPNMQVLARELVIDEDGNRAPPPPKPKKKISSRQTSPGWFDRHR